MALVSRTEMGLGQAGCPSMEQLEGIADSNDPCQNPVASLPVGQSSTTLSTIGISPSGALVPTTALPSSAALSTQLSQTNTTNYILIGGALLFVVFLIMGRGR